MPTMKRLMAMVSALALVLAVAAACGPSAKQIAMDKQGRPVKVARGTVSAKNFTPASVQMLTTYTSYGPMSTPVAMPAVYNITFAFDGLSKTYNDQARFAAFEQGQEVEVAYVRGKSGDVYVESISAVGPPKPPPVFNYTVMEEYFDAKKNIKEAQTFKIYSDAGKLNIRASKNQRIYSPVSVDHTQAFMVEAEVAKTSAGAEDAGYGLVLGRDADNCLVFVISGNKQCAVGLFANGQESMLKKWSPSSAIKDGANTLAIARKDGVTSFLINGQVVFDDPAAVPPGGRIGFALGKPMTLAADNLRIHADEKPMPEEAAVIEEVIQEPAPSPAQAQSPQEQLKMLHDAGLINDQEYQAKSAALRARQAPASDPEVEAKIESLNTLRDAGLLTEEEYKEKMRSLTGGP